MKTCNTCNYMLRNIDDLDESTPLKRLGTCQIKFPPFVMEQTLFRQVDIDKCICSFYTKIDDSIFGPTRGGKMTDKELEERVREELYMGCVEAAENWAHDIQDWELQREMKKLIREYEGDSSV